MPRRPFPGQRSAERAARPFYGEGMPVRQGLFTRDRAFYRTFLRLCLTLMVEQAVILSVNLADNLMIGSYSETALSGVAAVNQIQFVLQQVVYAASNGLIVLGSQYWGQGRREPIRRLCASGVLLALGLALAFFAAVSLFPVQTLSLFTKDAAIVAEGTAYLNIIRFTYPVFAMTTILLGSMRCVETVKIALRVSCVSLVVNCGINYVLIGGRFGAPELGARGAAIGTLTARVLELVIVLSFVLFRDEKLKLKPADLFRVSGPLTRDYLRVTGPILVTGALWGGFNAIQTMVLGHMTSNAIAAYSISSTIFLLLKVTSVGAATAAAILIGKDVGTGAMERLKTDTRTLQVIFLGIGLVLGTALFLLRLVLLPLYEIGPETRELANLFLIIQSVVICTMSYQMPVNTGIIRGGGDTKFVMYLDLVSIWGIVLPLSLLAAFVLHWHPAAVVLCLNADQIFKCVPAAIRVNGYRWVKKLTQEHV